MPLGQSFCFQCFSPTRNDWTTVEFYDSYSDALAAQFIAHKVFHNLSSRILRCNLEICD